MIPGAAQSGRTSIDMADFHANFSGYTKLRDVLLVIPRLSRASTSLTAVARARLWYESVSGAMSQSKINGQDMRNALRAALCFLALSVPAHASEIDCNGYRYGMKVRDLV